MPGQKKGAHLVFHAGCSFFGLPGGRILDSSPSFFPVFAFHSSDPNGWPRTIDSLTASCSAFVSDQFTRSFDLFTQLDQPADRAKGGIGIGLSLVQTLVQMHGGSVEAGAGRGSEFIVRLPLANSTSPPTNVQSTSGQITSPVTRRILVVDDNRDSAETLAMLLELTGHETLTAHRSPLTTDSKRWRLRPSLSPTRCCSTLACRK